MTKSLRSKREKMLRTLRREIADPFYDKKQSAKLKAQEEALNAPKLPICIPRNHLDHAMAVEHELQDIDCNPSASAMAIDAEMADGEKSKLLLKPAGGGVGKNQLKKKIKLKKDKRKGQKGRGKGNITRSNI